jgi:hypothetical protein
LGAPLTLRGIELDPRLFTEGKRYLGESNLEILVRHGTQPLDFTLGSFDMPVVIPSLAKHLQDLCPEALQVIPAAVTKIDRAVAILNVLDVRDAIDEQHSEITWWTKEDGLESKIGTYAGIGRIVLVRKRIDGAMMLRLKNWELPLIVSEQIKDAIQSAQTSGVEFEQLAVV